MLNPDITLQIEKAMVWKEVIEALDSIIDDYEKVNHLISFHQDDKVRNIGLNDCARAFRMLPTNSELESLVSSIYGSSMMKEHSLGGLITLTSSKS
jgi:hypothetical protein